MDNVEFDQTALMRGLILVFVGRSCQKVCSRTLRLNYVDDSFVAAGSKTVEVSCKN